MITAQPDSVVLKYLKQRAFMIFDRMKYKFNGINFLINDFPGFVYFANLRTKKQQGWLITYH